MSQKYRIFDTDTIVSKTSGVVRTAITCTRVQCEYSVDICADCCARLRPLPDAFPPRAPLFQPSTQKLPDSGDRPPALTSTKTSFHPARLDPPKLPVCFGDGIS